MTNIPLQTITVLSTGKVVGIGPNGISFPMGTIKALVKCVYGNCRATNLCKAGCCVGANLKSYGYVIEAGEIKKETSV